MEIPRLTRGRIDVQVRNVHIAWPRDGLWACDYPARAFPCHASANVHL